MKNQLEVNLARKTLRTNVRAGEMGAVATAARSGTNWANDRSSASWGQSVANSLYE